MAKDPKRVRAGKKSRNKGAGFERQVAKIITSFFGFPYEAAPRTPRSGGGSRKGDIDKLDDDFRRIFPFHIEAKKVEGWRLETLFAQDEDTLPAFLHSWWDQATEDCPSDEIPIVVFSKNLAPKFVLLDAIWIRNRLGPKYREIKLTIRKIASPYISIRGELYITTLEDFLYVWKCVLRRAGDWEDD